VTYTTAAGLLVTDRRVHHRAREVPQVDPRTHDPNPNAPSSVGPVTRAGEVMGSAAFGWHAEAWDGWPPDWQTPYYGDEWSGTGYGRDPITGRLSTAMTCADLNSRQLASFPVYGLRGSEPIALPGWARNPEPSLYASWPEFVHGVINCLELRGEAFLYATGRYAESAGGYPARFVVLNPDAVGVEWIDGRLEYLIEGDPVPNPRDVCHLKYQSWPGRLHGIGPLEWAGRSLATAGALERYASSLANRGGVPWAVLKSSRNIDGTQARDAQDAWVAGRIRADGAPAVIGNAFDLQPLTISLRDMALLELREFDERRICAAFGVPGYLVNVAMADGLTYANASQLFAHHWTATLRPLADLIAQAWSDWLLPLGTTLEFNPDRYVQPPFAERAGGYSTMFNIVDPASGRRAMELDEIRAAERLALEHPSDAASAQAQRLT